MPNPLEDSDIMPLTPSVQGYPWAVGWNRKAPPLLLINHQSIVFLADVTGCYAFVPVMDEQGDPVNVRTFIRLADWFPETARAYLEVLRGMANIGEGELTEMGFEEGSYGE